MKLTVQQYQECWRERIEKEQKATAQAVADNAAEAAKAAKAAEAAATAAAAPAADDLGSAISGMSQRSRVRSILPASLPVMFNLIEFA